MERNRRETKGDRNTPGADPIKKKINISKEFIKKHGE